MTLIKALTGYGQAYEQQARRTATPLPHIHTTQNELVVGGDTFAFIPLGTVRDCAMSRPVLAAAAVATPSAPFLAIPPLPPS